MGRIGASRPGWVELGSPDIDASRRFYTELFGWSARQSVIPGADGYTLFTNRGREVAGLGPVFAPGQPPAWTMFIATTDLDMTAKLVEASGGKVLMGPSEIAEYGRLAVFADRSGARFASWEGDGLGGAELIGHPGSMAWNELVTRDPDGAKSFYHDVFGWAAQDRSIGPVVYTEWQLATKGIAGMMPMLGDRWPGRTPAHWIPYFGVVSLEATAERLLDLGGSVSGTPTDVPAGRLALVTDQHGAVFSLLETSFSTR